MSFKVLVIPEDPTYNGYILKPLVGRIMQEAGKPSAIITVLTNPKLNGYEHAKSSLGDICDRYKHFNLFLFIPDNDCSKSRQEALAKLSKKMQANGYPIICLAALEELETWFLSAHKGKIDAEWKTIKEDCSIKENYFQPFLEEHGDDSPGGGREELMKEGLRRFKTILALNPEIQILINAIKKLLA